MRTNFFILLILSIVIFTVSCDKGDKVHKTSSPRYIEDLHTFVSFIAYTKSQKQFDQYFSTIKETCGKYSHLVSVNMENSEADKINQYASIRPVEVSQQLITLIKKCNHYSVITGGAFDITIKPVFDLWEFEENSIGSSSFGNAENSLIKPPDKSLIKEKLKLVGYENIQIQNHNKVKFRKKGVQILLGGVAKGFLLDKIKEALINQGLKSGLIEAGGDVIIFGSKPGGDKWRVGIKNPRPDNESMPHIEGNPYIVLGLELENKSIVTSGDYEQYYIDSDGKRRHHIINPQTGYSTESVISATVVANSIIDADILSTAIFVMGADEGIKLIETLSDTEAHIIYTYNGNGFAMKSSSGFDRYIAVSYDKSGVH